MTLKTDEVNKYLKKIYHIKESKVDMIDDVLSFNLINKLNDTIFVKYFSDIINFKDYLQNVLKKKVISAYDEIKLYYLKDYDYIINIKILNDKQIKNIYNYLKETDRKKKLLLLDKFNECYLYPKHKKGDINDVENYRFLSQHSIELKVIDRIISDIIMTLTPNILDINIYKAQLKKGLGDNCIKTATNNTINIDNVLLLDISKAFDSVNWKILYDNMILILSTILNSELAINIVNEYFLILKYRKFIYRQHKKSKKHYHDVTIGISQGLPGSNLIFTLLICSLVNKWKTKLNTNIGLNIDKYLKLNIYIDDFYIKFFDTYSDKNILITNYLINELELHGFIVNKLKSLADTKLQLNFPELKSSNLYLGIPFTRNIKEYKNCIMSNYISKEKNKLFINNNNIECTWISFYNIIINKKKLNKKKYDITKRLNGYLQYKLKPIIKYILNIDNITNNILIKFIHNYFLQHNIMNINNNFNYLTLVNFNPRFYNQYFLQYYHFMSVSLYLVNNKLYNHYLSISLSLVNNKLYNNIIYYQNYIIYYEIYNSLIILFISK